MAQRPGAGFSSEVVWRVTLSRLRADRAWAVLGVALPFAAVLVRLVLPLDLRTAFDQLQLSTKLLALYYLGFTACYLAFLWLNPHRGDEDQDLATLPLPEGQRLLQRMLVQAALPLCVFFLSLPAYGALLALIGLPYGQAPENTTYLVSNNWDNWTEWRDPYHWRVLFAVLIMLSCVLLPLALGILLNELVARPLLRVPVLFGAPLGLFFLVRATNDEYTRWCYKQGRGLSPWAFLAVWGALVLSPFALGLLKGRGRQLLALLAVLTAALGAALPFARYQLPGSHTTAALRSLLGDGRYALGYFTGHLSPALNLELIFNSYPSNVLLNNHRVGDLIPQHVALWVGAGIYPVALPLLALALYFAGAVLAARRPRHSQPQRG